MTDARSRLMHLAKNRQKTGSRRTDLLARFYPHKKLSTRDMPGDDGSNMYDFVSKQVKKGLLEKADGTPGRRYQLTRTGRICVLRGILGVSFLCMCILTEAYVVNAYQAKNRTRLLYPSYELVEQLARIYSRKSIRNTTSRMCRSGFATHVGRQIIALRGPTMKRLERHDVVIRELHDIISGL